MARLAGHDERAVRTRVLDAVALLPAGCALGGWASRWWQGGQYVDGQDGRGDDLPVLLHMTRGHQLRRRPGITVTRARVDDADLALVDGVLVTTLARAAFDHMCQLCGVVDAVVVADMATGRLLDGQATTCDDIAEVWRRRHRVRGRPQVERALSLSCDRSMSPWETRLRVFAAEALAGSRWEVNVPIFDLRGDLAGVVDLLDLTSGLAVEWDGAQHREPTAHAADCVRAEAYGSLQLLAVRVSAPDWVDRVRLRRRLVAARRRALAVSAPDRLWTTTKPAWWRGSRAAQHWE